MSRNLNNLEIPEPDILKLQAKLFRGLAELSRLSILDVLKDGPRPVGEIVAATGLTQSNISNHLRCLHDCGLVANERQGRYIFYKLSDPRIASLLEIAKQLLDGVLSCVEDCTHYQ